MKRTAALVLLLIPISSCRTPLPSATPLPVDDPRPARLMSDLADDAERRGGLRAALQLSLDAPDLRFDRPQRMALARPAQLRVEILGLFGQIAALLVTNGETWQYFDARKGDFESGRVAPHFLWQFARVDLTPEEAVGVLLGAPSPEPGWERSAAAGLSDGGVAIDYRDRAGALRGRYEFGATGLLRSVESWDDGNVLAWRAEFSDHRDIAGSSFAHEVVLLSKRVDARAEFSFDHVELNPDLDGSLFVLEPPAGR